MFLKAKPWNHLTETIKNSYSMESKFLNDFKEILEIEDREIALDDNFREYPEWDSLANLSVMAMIDEEYGVVIENAAFREIHTIRELFKAIQKKVN